MTGLARGNEREACCCFVVLIKLIVRVRHALIHKVMTLVYMFIHTLKCCRSCLSLHLSEISLEHILERSTVVSIL